MNPHALKKEKSTMLKANYTFAPTNTPGVVEIGITPKSLVKLTAKTILLSVILNLPLIAWLFWPAKDESPKYTEDHLPETD